MKSLSPKTIDLHQSFFRRERLTQRQKAAYLKYGAPAAALLVMVLVSGVFYYNAWQLRNQYKPLEVYLTNSATNEVYDKALELQRTDEQLRRTYQNTVEANAVLASYPKLTKAVFEVIFGSRSDNMTVGEINFTGATGLLTIAGTAQKITDPADYVEKLKRSGCFEKVEYVGYSSADEKAKEAGVVNTFGTEYTFTVSCYLTAPVEVIP